MIFRRTRRILISRATLAAVCGCACVIWNKVGSAQSSSLEPHWLPTSQHATVDGPSSATGDRFDKRTDHIRFGALLGVGFPRPLTIEGVVKLERVLALGLEYSALPQITISEVRVRSSAIAVSVRLFPLHGAFFVGLRAGRQSLGAEALVSGYGYKVPVALGVDTTFLNPQLGFLWTWEPGVSIGVDAGLQIPLSSSTSSSVQTTVPNAVQPLLAPAQHAAESVAGAVGRTTLPTVDLIRIGVLF